MERTRLKDIANIQMGLVLSRSGTKKSVTNQSDATDENICADEQKYKVITLRSINEQGLLDINQCDNFITQDKLTDRYLTLKDDILIRLFLPLRSCLISKAHEDIIIPSQFGIVRLKEEVKQYILPEYLHLIMQNAGFSEQVQKSEWGTQLRSVKISSFENCEIIIPPISQQHKLLNISRLMNRQELLMSRLSQQQKLEHKIILENLIRGEKL